MIPGFPKPSVGCYVVPGDHECQIAVPSSTALAQQLNPTTAASRRSQKQENQSSGELLKCDIVA